MSRLRYRSLARLISIFALAMLGSFPRRSAGRPVSPPSPDPARQQRLAWFHEAKFGLFIHWGRYAIPAGEWQG